MITTMEKPYKSEQINIILNPIVKKWFFNTFKEYSLPQLYGVMVIHSSEKGILEDKIYCVYISPLRALNEDIKINLINPLNEMEKIVDKKFGIRVGVRTGDTDTAEKAKQLKKPPHILITTPESLAIVLSSIKFIDHLKDVQWCIV